MTIGERLKRLRAQKGWTQDELAQHAGMNGRHISRYEKGHLEPPRKTLLRLAEALKVPVQALLEDEPAYQLLDVIPDPELLEQFRIVARMTEEDRQAVKRVLSMITMKQQMHEMVTGKSA